MVYLAPISCLFDFLVFVYHRISLMFLLFLVITVKKICIITLSASLYWVQGQVCDFKECGLDMF